MRACKTEQKAVWRVQQCRFIHFIIDSLIFYDNADVKFYWLWHRRNNHTNAECVRTSSSSVALNFLQRISVEKKATTEEMCKIFTINFIWTRIYCIFSSKRGRTMQRNCAIFITLKSMARERWKKKNNQRRTKCATDLSSVAVCLIGRSLSVARFTCSAMILILSAVFFPSFQFDTHCEVARKTFSFLIHHSFMAFTITCNGAECTRNGEPGHSIYHYALVIALSFTLTVGKKRENWYHAPCTLDSMDNMP